MKVLLEALGLLTGALVLILAAPLLLPFALVWCGVLLLTDLCTGAAKPAPLESEPRVVNGASIMILNWDGRELLERLLPSLRIAIAHDGGDHEVIVIDNGSSDDSVAFVTEHFPEVVVVRHDENLKFVRGYNDAFAAAKKDVVVLLNNDMIVDEGFLPPLLRGFRDPETFAVSSQIFLADPEARRVETGLTGGWVQHGVLKLRHDDVAEHVTGLIPVLWAGGGSSAFDRRKLEELGGFDSLYDPFYFEDTGLSFEAWKRGWNVLLAPESKVTHAHQASSSRFSRTYVASIKRRNQHLFTWRHLTNPRTTITSTLLLPLNVGRMAFGQGGSSLLHRAIVELRGLAATLPRLPSLLAKRVKNARLARRTDDEVFLLAHSRHRFERSQQRERLTVTSRKRILMLAARVPKHGVDGSWGLFELIKVLGREHEVTLFTLTDHADDARHIEALKPFVQRIETAPLGRDIGTLDLHHRVPLRLRGSYSAPELRERVDALLRTEPYDILQVDYIEMASLVADFVGGVDAIHVVHEPLFLALLRQRVSGIVPKIIRWLRYVQSINYEARLYPKFARIVCLTPEDERELRRWDRVLRTHVNPMGVDIDRIRPAPPSTGTTILSVSYFGHPPNVDAAVWFAKEVLPIVRASVPDAQLRLIGGGAPPAIEALAKEPGVEVLGYVADLDPEMAQCTVAIAPVREGGGLRTKVLESFAYGRTMVVTPIATAGIDAEDGKELRVAANAEDFAAAVVSLLADPEVRHAMETAARDLVLDRYTNQRMAERQLAVMDELLAQRGQQ